MTTDDLLDTLIRAQESLNEAEVIAGNLAKERDAALVLARKTGTGPTQLARLTGLSRGRVNQILTRAGLTAP